MITELPIRAPETAEAASPGATDVPNPVWSTRLARPRHPVLEDHGLVWRGSELAESVTGLAGRLARGGVRPGETVALCGPPSPEWIIAFHALGWLGAAVAPIAPGAAREELAAALELSGAERVFVAHGLTRPEREALEAVAPHARYLTSLPLGPAPAERFWPLEEARLVLLTSGTTGRARPIRLTTAQLVFSAFGSAIRLGHHADDRWLACLPFHHVGGLSILVRCAFYGTTVVLRRRFRPAEVARALDAGEATLVSLVPSMLRDVLDARPARPFPKTLRAVLLGGDAAPDELLARCAELDVPVALTWGMTETASQVATRAPGDLDAACGGGAPLPFARVSSEGGHLAVRGPLANGVVRTRDRGVVDFAGRVHVSGRAEAFVTSGGETFAVREVEEVLELHPDVAAAAVLPVADPRWGERPLAVLVARDPSRRPDDALLRAWCRARLARFKTPDAFAWIEALPRTGLGKLARGQLAARFGRPARRRARRPSAPPTPPAPLPRPDPDVLARLLAAAERFGPSAFAGRVEAAEAALREDLLALEAEVAAGAERLPGPPELRARQAALTLVGIPGKRLRPLCTLLAARLAGRAPDHGALAAAAACELIHTATLLHDDVVDEATARRGAPAARVVWGNSASILAGDYLFAEALRGVGALGEGELLPRLLEVIAEMAVAEALQLERRGRVEPDLDVCLRIVRGKTAALFRWALWAGGRLGGLPPDACAALGRAGDALGTAFQLADDLLDLAGDPAAIGKDALADVRQGKLTWPLALAVQADPELGRELTALASEDEADDEVAARAAPLLARVRASDALARTRDLAEREAARARRELASLPSGWPRALLETIVTLAVRRGA